MSTFYDTERLTIRTWDAADVDVVFDMYSRWEVQRFLGAAPQVMTDRSEAVERVARWSANTSPQFGAWAVTLRDTGLIVGTVMLKELPLSAPSEPAPPSGDIEVGWHLHPDAWGNGYATEAATGALRHGFDLGLSEIFAVTYPENVRSQAVCRRLGMAELGTTKRYYNTTCQLFRSTPPGR